jgi:hypothetical protein
MCTTMKRIAVYRVKNITDAILKTEYLVQIKPTQRVP